MKILTMAICITIMLGLAGASQYSFGTKVMSFDSDFGAPLRAYGLPNVPPLTVGYWETGVVLGFDDTDVVYVHQGPLLAVPPGIHANDVRLTPFGYLPAGSKVTPQDNDIGMPLLPFPVTATISWVNLYGGPGHDLNDPIYIAQLLGFTTTNDIRLTNVAGKPPGSKVGNLDLDLPKAFAPPWPPTNPNPIAGIPAPFGIVAPPLSVQYVDVNGNNQYDYPDDVYLITGLPPSPVVRANDVRLSGPA